MLGLIGFSSMLTTVYSVAQLGLLAVSVQLDPSVARVGLAPRVLPALLVL